jgi:cardiolipin synthase
MHRLLLLLPNLLTVARLLMLPVIVIAYGRDVPGASWAAAILIVIAGLSDVIDGLLARELNAYTEFGRWLDPIVDRVFFFTLVTMLWAFGTLPWWAVLPVLVRDGIILLLVLPVRRFTSAGPAVSQWGRASNVILLLGVQWFIVDLRFLGWVCYGTGLLLYCGSGLLYVYQGARFLSEQRSRPPQQV